MAVVYCGTSGWNYKHWRGVFYPDKLAASLWLRHYSLYFDTVELNNSFYRLPEKSTFEKWRRETPEGFVFSVKASRYLTHIKKLKDPEEPLTRLLDHASGLGDKLGPVLYQFPPNWGIDLDRLEMFLKILPSGLRHVFEFRNESWHNDRLWDLLKSYNVAYCIMDHPDLPNHVRVTADFSYIRMHSGGYATDSNYTYGHLNECSNQIRELLKQGDVYVYFNNDHLGYAVQNALLLKNLLNGRKTMGPGAF